MRVEELQFESAEKLPIRATLTHADKPRGLFVLVHGFKGFRQWGFFPWLSEELASRGFSSCRFDMSRNGVGEDGESFDRLDLFADDTYSVQVSDLGTVLSALDARSDLIDLPRTLFGYSRGGATVLLGAHLVRNLYRVVTWSGISRLDRWDDETVGQWRRDGVLEIINARTGQSMPVSTRILDDVMAGSDHLNLTRAISRLSVPWLVVHGGADETVPVSEGRALASMKGDVSLVVIEGAGHTFGAIHPLVTVPQELSLAFEATVSFLA